MPSTSDKITVPVECCVRRTSAQKLEQVRHALIHSYLTSLSSVIYRPGPLAINPEEHPFLVEHASGVEVVDVVDRPDLAGRPILAWDINWQASMFWERKVM